MTVRPIVKVFKKVLSLSIILTLLVTGALTPENTQAEGNTTAKQTPQLLRPFNDVAATNRNALFINYLANRGIMKGFPDGTFKPEEGLTRAQAAVLLVQIKGLFPESREIPFSDVPVNHWAYKSINAAYSAGFLYGYTDGTFRPDSVLTRAEGIVLLLRLSGHADPEEVLPELKDVTSDHWAADSIAVGIASEMMELTGDGKHFRPDVSFARGDLARALGNLLTKEPTLYKTSLQGTLTKINGTVILIKGHGQQITQIKDGTNINEGDTIKVEQDSSCEIVFPDGSGMRLLAGTELTIKEARGRSCIMAEGTPGTMVDWLEIVLHSGKIFGALTTRNEISHQNKQEKTAQLPWYKIYNDKRIKVKVNMPYGVANIRGAFWENTVSGDGRSRTSLLTGEGEVTSGEKTVTLESGQSTQVRESNMPPASPIEITAEEVDEWFKVRGWAEERAQNINANRELSLPPVQHSGQQQTGQSQLVQDMYEIIHDAYEKLKKQEPPETAGGGSYTGGEVSNVNHAPIVSNVLVNGTTKVGNTLTGSYTYSDPDSDMEGATVFKWYRSHSADGTGKEVLSGAAGKIYTLTEADEGKYIFFEVIPIDVHGLAGNAVCTATAQIQAVGSVSYEYVGQWGGLCYDPEDGKFVHQNLYGVAVDAMGNVYVTDNNSRIQKFDSNGSFIGKLLADDKELWLIKHQFRGIAVDSDGRIYVTDGDADNIGIQVFEATGDFENRWGENGTDDGQFYPGLFGAVVDSLHVYVSDVQQNRVQKFSTKGDFEVKWGIAGSDNGQFDKPFGMAVDSEGYVYVVDSGNNRIQKFNSEGVYVDQWGSNGNGDGQFDCPTYIAIDADGNIYVTDTKNNRVQKFDEDGNYLTQWGTRGAGEGEFDNPRGIAVDVYGNVYVADANNNRIQKFRRVGSHNNSTINPTTVTFDKNSPADVEILVNLNGNELSEISNGEYTLIENTDYTYGENILIKKEYLIQQPTGDLELTFKFSAGDDSKLMVSITGAVAAAAPTAQPAAGEVQAGTAITFNSAAEDAQIRYTTDGSDPTPTTGMLYDSGNKPVVTSAITFKAIVCKEGMIPSEVVSFNYTVKNGGSNNIIRVSVASDNTEAKIIGGFPGIELHNYYPTISQDGRYVAFYSNATNLVENDNNQTDDIFVRDRDADGNGVYDENEAGTVRTFRVSTNTEGGDANGNSYMASFSADGHYVAFISGARNLVPDDGNQKWDVFVCDLQTNSTTRVSVPNLTDQAELGTEANKDSYASNFTAFKPSVSNNGLVSFASNANNLVVEDKNIYSDVFVHNLLTQETKRISVSNDRTEGNSWSFHPVISADGCYVAFISDASNLVTGDTNGKPDIFVHELKTGKTVRVSIASDGTQANSFSGSIYYPSRHEGNLGISSDGRYVVFESLASNLVEGDTNGCIDIFVHDRDADGNGIYDEAGAVTTTRVSVASDGQEADKQSEKPSISSDGRYVTFTSDATNLVPGLTGEITSVYVHDLIMNKTTLVTVMPDGSQSEGAWPSISGNGQYITFYSEDSMVTEDKNGSKDIFVYKLQP